ncbi:S-layer homology domain-containing protein [Dethiosulfatibacter aminovorans DSM 17477]|uniref:S-layer homology domain-containing protein n=1 Tax=Dethiosulfatibacter aminovorans DSM 17477 TaxID=1121476 RepID=A0A1M6LPC0_9FIRM|nr:S-layer homology domain-containing protein [Dethiosulfatibacter aminovorans]SHJ72922.1 S-layer homology domain-containing protein [Dethiosulfatibacter aminovorans DSM 17477]
MGSFKKRIAVLTLIIVLVLSQLSLASAVELDYEGHWAQDTIEEWFSNGIVKGYSDGSFKPDNVVTRAEFVTMINNLFGFVDENTDMFADVTSDDWFYHNVNKAATAGIIKGANNLFRPQDMITRQEAAVVLSRAFLLKADNEYAYSVFNDRENVADWAIASVNALVESDYMKGRGNNELAPLANLTRAEALTLVSNIAGKIVEDPLTMTGNYPGNLVINEADVVLADVDVKGNLYITEGVGDGDVTLDNVIVEGELVVLGGGENSIKINNSDIGSVLVVKMGGDIRIVAIGDTSIDNVDMMSGGILEEYELTGSGFGEVEVLTVGEGEDIVLDGDFDRITVDAPVENITVTDGTVGSLVIDNAAADVKVTVDDSGVLGTLEVKEAVNITVNGDVDQVNVEGPVAGLIVEGGSIGGITVSAEAEGAAVDLQAGCVVETLTIDGTVDVQGEGVVEEAVVNAEDVTFDVEPEEVSGTADSITVGTGDDAAEVEVEKPLTGGGFGGGGTVSPSTVNVTVAFTSSSGLDEILTLEVSSDADGYEIAKEFLDFFVLNFDNHYEDIEDAILGNDGMLLIDALTFFEYAEDEDLSGTIFNSLPGKAGDEFTPEEKKAMFKELLTVIADNLTDGDVVKSDMITVAERVDFSLIKYDGHNFKSLEIIKDGTSLDKFEQGSDKANFISAVMDPLTDIDADSAAQYEMIIILDDGNDTTKISTFETL